LPFDRKAETGLLKNLLQLQEFEKKQKKFLQNLPDFWTEKNRFEIQIFHTLKKKFENLDFFETTL
jgi:hypothetical protein